MESEKHKHHIVWLAACAGEDVSWRRMLVSRVAGLPPGAGNETEKGRLRHGIRWIVSSEGRKGFRMVELHEMTRGIGFDFVLALVYGTCSLAHSVSISESTHICSSSLGRGE